jgi:hypothetical protein
LEIYALRLIWLRWRRRAEKNGPPALELADEPSLAISEADAMKCRGHFRKLQNNIPERARHFIDINQSGRKSSARNGATVQDLDSLCDWEGGDMAAPYSEAANQKRSSMRAMGALERSPDEHSMDAPMYRWIHQRQTHSNSKRLKIAAAP